MIIDNAPRAQESVICCVRLCTQDECVETDTETVFLTSSFPDLMTLSVLFEAYIKDINQLNSGTYVELFSYIGCFLSCLFRLSTGSSKPTV